MRSLILDFGGKHVEIYGGPYFERPSSCFGVKVAQEIDLPCNISLQIRDYSVPDEKQAKRALLGCIKALSRGESLYVGCWGGKGRTGLFLALLAKSAGVADPVGYVRSTFNAHAVETEEQKKYVESFPAFWLRWAYKAASVAARLEQHHVSTPPGPR